MTAVGYSRRIDQALLYAHDLHRTQTRKGGGVPYFVHLLAVAALVGDHGGDEDQVIAALLHDAVEDQGGDRTAAEIERRFGRRVAQIVLSCSDSRETPRPPWRERKERFLQHLPNAPEDALLVVLADKVHNACALVRDLESEGARVWSRFHGGRDGTLWYYREVTQILRARTTSPLVRTLQHLVSRLETLAHKTDAQL